MRTIGKFQVVEKIGEGGFGVIYKGLDPHIKRHVAIKSCTSKDEHVRTRFAQEAQISGNLHHRHIVTVYDFGHQDGVPYLVQEYLNGEDLDRKIKRRDYIPFPEKLLYLMQIARGLQYAHSQGVIHRDIKPANLRILEDGTAKIMDFGIAKLTNQDTGLTQTGMTLGTAAYLAPEQIRGEGVDVRTDIFAFGATAYELLTYRRPFVGQHISTVLYQILNEEPPSIVSVLPEIPEEIDQLVMKCLEKDLNKRYSDVGELLRDLDRVLKKRRTEITTKTLQPAEAESDSKTRANRLAEQQQAAERTVVSSATPTPEGPAGPP
ncbi:MAG: serine/threonine protein kinase, partial [Thermoanaerobaculia bacterium]|nr:serine/threonine protein kinase [Thermoanaerobaculia bacterium]